MADKPKKPTPDFPLTPHNNGQWAKKVKGRLYYFGPWADPQGALDRYNAWLAGEPAKPTIKSAPTNGKPGKPYKDFPLYAHHNGQWAKKVRGITRFFGPWANPQAALDLWLEQKDDLLAGREPRATGEGLTIVSLVNQFLASKKNLVKTGELTQRTWNEYDAICSKIIDVFGRNRLAIDLRHTDFERLRMEFTKGLGEKRKGHGPTTLSNDVGRARAVFNYAFKQSLIDRPIRFGDGFKKPSQRVLRKERNKKGPKMFMAPQIRAMLDKAGLQLKAMILLGINCGVGNHDCAVLTTDWLDLKTGWYFDPREKTGVQRRAKLWPETVAALQAVLEKRKTPNNPAHAKHVFITKYGNLWEETDDSKAIGNEMGKLIRELEIHRRGFGFYTLRHTLETIGGESMDQAAVDRIMGHAPHANDMRAVYRERMTDKRLFRVAKYVRKWLFNKKSRKVRAAAAPASASPAGE
jgi:integrase